jgi:hypothetical protein
MNCHETVTVNAKAVNWLKEKYPELCIKAGLCERVAGRLYTKTLTTPPAAQREWVGLTDTQVYDLADTHLYDGGKNYGILNFYGAIEKALKEKNHGMA